MMLDVEGHSFGQVLSDMDVATWVMVNMGVPTWDNIVFSFLMYWVTMVSRFVIL